MVTLKDPKVVQILNNNVVSAVAGDGMEVILTGKGLGFAVRAGSEVDLNRVEKVFCLQAGDAVSERLKMLIESLNKLNTCIFYSVYKSFHNHDVGF